MNILYYGKIMDLLYRGDYDEICNWLYDKLDALHSHGHGSEFIVKLLYCYTGEKVWTESNEVLWFDSKDNMVWLNDWWEGQQNILLLGYMPVEDIELEVMIHGPEQHNG